MRDAVELYPQRIEGEFHHVAAVADPSDMKLRRRQANFLAGFGAAKADAERPVDCEHVEAEKADDGPGAHQEERNAGGETHHADKGHHHQEAGAVERAVRCQPRRKQLRLAIRIKIIACGHDLLLYTSVADLTFALVPRRVRKRMSNPKPHWKTYNLLVSLWF